MKMRVIITGSTGMVGEGVLHCVSQGYPQNVLEVKDIVLLANRRA